MSTEVSFQSPFTDRQPIVPRLWRIRGAYMCVKIAC